MKTNLSSVSVLIALVAVSASATDYTWSNGAGTFSWADAGNWSPEGVPGEGDNITFNANAEGDVIAMDGDRTVKKITFGGNVRSLTLGSPADTLTVTDAFSGGWMGPACTTTIAAKLHLVKDTQVASHGPWGKQIVFASEIFDDGNGYGIYTGNDQNQCMTLTGANTYSGATLLQAYSHSLGGADGSLLRSPVILSGVTSTTVSMALDNSVAANSNRLPDDFPVTFRRSVSKLQLNGHPTDEIVEKVGGFVIESGGHTVQVVNKGAPVTLEVGSVKRSGAGAIIADGVNTTTTRFVIDGAVDNGHGICEPWIIMGGWDIKHATVDANGAVTGAKYTDFPMDSDASADVLYSTPTKLGGLITLTRDQSVYGLRLYNDSTNVTLNLGDYDLHVGPAGLGFCYAHSRTVTASGDGALVFDGPNVVMFGRNNGWPAANGTVVIDAPMDTTSPTPPELCVPLISDSNGLQFLGEDRIGTYSNVMVTLASGSTPFTLGGPSDRTFLGTYSGAHKLVKTGPGTLTLACENVRAYEASSIEEGRVVLANPRGLGVNVTVTNAVLEIAPDLVVSNFNVTFNAGSTLTGGGDLVTSTTIKFAGDTTIAPGNGVGRLSLDRMLFSNNAVYEWELGDGTEVPGVDYDLLSAPRGYWGGFKFSGGKVKLAVKASGSGWEKVKGKTFTIAEWTGGGDIVAPSEVEIFNLSPRRLITDDAVVTFDTNAKKVYLSGLLSYPSGTLIQIR